MLEHVKDYTLSYSGITVSGGIDVLSARLDMGIWSTVTPYGLDKLAHGAAGFSVTEGTDAVVDRVSSTAAGSEVVPTGTVSEYLEQAGLGERQQQRLQYAVPAAASLGLFTAATEGYVPAPEQVEIFVDAHPDPWDGVANSTAMVKYADDGSDGDYTVTGGLRTIRDGLRTGYDTARESEALEQFGL